MDLAPNVVQTVASCGIGLGYSCVILILFQKRLWKQIKTSLGINLELTKGPSASVHAESSSSVSAPQNSSGGKPPRASSGDISSSPNSSELENRIQFSSSGSNTADMSASTVTRADLSSGSRSQSFVKYKPIEPIQEETSVSRAYENGISKFEPVVEIPDAAVIV